APRCMQIPSCAEPSSSRSSRPSEGICRSWSAREGSATPFSCTRPSTIEADMNPDAFVNRELSWLEFNRRVLEEAQDPSVPLLERVRFLAIFSANLDEFFMVRVAELKRRLGAGDQTAEADGLTTAETIA